MSEDQVTKVLIVDDDREMRDSLSDLLESAGLDPLIARSGKAAKQVLKENPPHVILCDVRMPGMTGLDLLQELKPELNTPIVMMSAHGDIPMAVEALQRGAYSFLEKPFDPRRLLNIIKNAASLFDLQAREKRLKARLADLTNLDRMVLGESAVIRSLKEDIIDFADIRANVLIVGETGTGKELIARAIHDLGPRSDEAYITFNCASTSKEAYEETVFGIDQSRDGILQQADGGTLFLDELSAMPFDFQAKMVRVIERGEFSPVGTSLLTKVDVRIISAVDEPLEHAASHGAFRSDLLYRINNIVLSLPGLRQRPDDIELLFSHFTQRFAAIYQVKVPPLTSDDIAALLSHDWPGNVRELSNVCERHVLSCRRGNSSVKAALALDDDIDAPENLRGAVAAFERQLISKALIAQNGRMDAVAEALGISRRTLNEKIVKLDLDKDKVLGQSTN